ncbi:hypothetical protein [Saccharopolyspora pogona]|uniref:hypothetical protein n=1 Tax=Saccharopolyspora pogona TaxID=333966 RepID=UPI001684BB8A|nr:hypothetical protein [Saccharopolyspora pogona]
MRTLFGFASVAVVLGLLGVTLVPGPIAAVARAVITARRGRDTATVAVARTRPNLIYYGLCDGHIRALHTDRHAGSTGSGVTGYALVAGLTRACPHSAGIQTKDSQPNNTNT